MATYYVDLNDGDDDAAGTSEGTAWLTLDKASVFTSNNDRVYVWGSNTINNVTFSAIDLIGGADGPADGGRSTLIANSSSGFLLQMANPGVTCANLTLDLDGNSCNALSMANAFSTASNIEVKNGDGTDYLISANGCLMQGFYIHDNDVDFAVVSSGSIVNSVFVNNTGCTEVFEGSNSCYNSVFLNNDGYAIGVTGNSFLQNLLIVGQGSHGIHVTASSSNELMIANTLIASCGGYGINFNGSVPRGVPLNLFGHDNTSGNVSGSAGNPIYDFCTNIVNDPFVNAAGGDYNFNSTAGGGAVLRAITEAIAA